MPRPTPEFVKQLAARTIPVDDYHITQELSTKLLSGGPIDSDERAVLSEMALKFGAKGRKRRSHTCARIRARTLAAEISEQHGLWGLWYRERNKGCGKPYREALIELAMEKYGLGRRQVQSILKKQLGNSIPVTSFLTMHKDKEEELKALQRDGPSNIAVHFVLRKIEKKP
jgi:hypothetical protein